MTSTSHRHLLSTSINNLANRLGVTQRTIRLYEEHGLITAGRNERNVRVYDPQQVERLTLVVALRQVGVGIAEISRFLRLPQKDADRAMHERLIVLRDRKNLELAHLDRLLDDLGNGVSLRLTPRGISRGV